MVLDMYIYIMGLILSHVVFIFHANKLDNVKSV